MDVDADILEQQRAIMRQIEEDRINCQRSQVLPQLAPRQYSQAYSSRMDNQSVNDTLPELLLGHTLWEHERRTLSRATPQHPSSPRIQSTSPNREEMKSGASQKSNTSYVTKMKGSKVHRSDAIKPSVSKKIQSVSKKDQIFLEDSVLDTGRRRVRVAGMSNTFQDISTGQAELVQCPGCQGYLQVSPSARNLFCTLCQQVSPMDLVRSSRLARLCDVDNRLARAIQQQDLEVKSKSSKSERSKPNIKPR